MVNGEGVKGELPDAVDRNISRKAKKSTKTLRLSGFARD